MRPAVTQDGGEVILGKDTKCQVQQIGIWDAGPGKDAWIASFDKIKKVRADAMPWEGATASRHGVKPPPTLHSKPFASSIEVR
ncbi:hypothetical protein Pth03_58720 [Planotetraspora thailandica]|uniref:Uncharacterized protein n=1 Tax=Planotetraspora thailandica TaxID=487172 RepID=A0A8J3XZC8_9ACTN|nr:hypothetical protein Pth03_58720 [Planotetraspora thailandica]